MNTEIVIEPLTKAAFAPFGEILEADGAPDKIINQGMCGRHHDLATLDFVDGHAGISIFDAQVRALPYELVMMERHPKGSQAFVPMSYFPFLIIVASDANGAPHRPRAFLSNAGQGINFHRNTWHGVLTPLHAPGLFCVIDRIGDGANLEEFFFDTPYVVVSKS